MCENPDTSPDPSVPASTGITRYWCQGKRDKKGRNIGKYCWYCLRLFDSRYKSRFGKIKAFKDKVGTDTDLHKIVTTLLEELIEKCIEVGGALSGKIRFNFAEAEERATLRFMSTKRTSVQDAKDQMIPLCEYEVDLDEQGVAYGHPDTNGKGHKKVWSENEWWVMVPPKSRRKLVGREHLIDHVLTKDISDNQLALSADELSIQQQQHHAMHDIARATGEKGYGQLPIAAAAASAASSTPPPSASTPLLDDTERANGLVMGFGIVPVEAPTPKAATGTADASAKAAKETETKNPPQRSPKVHQPLAGKISGGRLRLSLQQAQQRGLLRLARLVLRIPPSRRRSRRRRSVGIQGETSSPC